MFVDHDYCAKILLFGEYTVIFGGNALAIPYPKYSGKWEKHPTSDKRLFPFLAYLNEINADLHFKLDLDKLDSYWTRGWIFNSTIPDGYGLGSSGAFCASVYHTSWHSLKIHPTPQQAKEDLARLENYFHGKSSGFDALVSLYGSSILFWKRNIELCTLPDKIGHQWSLWNTGISRSTGPLVHQFRNKLIQPSFKQKMEQLTDLSNTVLKAYLSGEDYFDRLKAISQLQFEYLHFLIPPHCMQIWEKSLTNPDIAVKLCGAGGGGYLLVCTQTDSDTRRIFDHIASELIYPSE